MKAQLPKREPEWISQWEKEDLYGQIRKARKGSKQFILHDGPPYANGNIHIGHAMNKILKDVIIRFKTMQGFDAPYVPGWDCHGMPIEHQLFKELKLKKDQIEQTEFREKARDYAAKYVAIQRDQFKRLGILGEWGNPYLTMAQDYELTILRMFKELLRAGYIYHGKKPVYWCATCETALAEAEVEYEDRQDTSIYVAFPIVSKQKTLTEKFGDVEHLAAAVWTTTPWTLPANVALSFNPKEIYVAVKVTGSIYTVLVAKSLVADFTKKLGIEAVPTDIGMSGIELAGFLFQPPFSKRQSVAVVDDFVSVSEGTGIVHIAPGHGQEDYLIGKRYKLDVISPVDHKGRVTKEVPQWEGQTVWEANPTLISALKNRGELLKEEPIQHSFPHCWRCKKPVIFRATPQWFLNISHQDLRKRLIESAKTVRWIPSGGLSRMTGMLETRPDWCLSRQRYWGTPIPMLHCKPCDRSLDQVEVVEEIEKTLAEKGVDAWFLLTPKELAPNAKCSACNGDDLRKETDILDVWFDSGVSHEAVLRARDGLNCPAQMYLEGSDQHRGWFQVSLIPSVALYSKPPYQEVLTHGFVMDGQGRKMSKSFGNVVAPQDVMERYGADILRLWAASSDYREDVRISDEIVAQAAESYRKIRNTFRYLLANLYDYDPKRDSVELSSCHEIDQWAMYRLDKLLESVTQAYETYQFHELWRCVYQFCITDMSSFYLDALKDRLYTESPTGSKRRCAQTVLYAVLQTLVRVIAPVMSLTAEEIWQLMRQAKWVEASSVHLSAWPRVSDTAFDGQAKKRWSTFIALRVPVMKALEEQRSQRTIGSPLEAQATLVVNSQELAQVVQENKQILAEVFVVSAVDVKREETPSESSPVPGLVGVSVKRAEGSKCQRCWKYLTSVGSVAAHPELCDRCAGIVAELKA